jgi:hypothetical protein
MKQANSQRQVSLQQHLQDEFAQQESKLKSFVDEGTVIPPRHPTLHTTHRSLFTAELILTNVK